MKKQFISILLLSGLMGLCGCSNSSGNQMVIPPKTTAASESTFTETNTENTHTEVSTANNQDENATEENVTGIVSDETKPALSLDSSTTDESASDDSSASSISSTTSTVASAAADNNSSSEMRLAGVKIGIDPGHQRHPNTEQETIAPNNPNTKNKVNGGAQGVSTKIPEYETVLEISMLLREKLQANGAEVYMTRESHDVNISNQERTKMMNDYGVDLLLRIHCDSTNSSSAHGVAFYVSQSNAIAAQSYAYAQTILPIVAERTGAPNRGIVQNDNYTGQNWAEVPCIMIECGFVSNPEEDVLLNSHEYQETLTDAITEGVLECFQ